MPAAADEDAPDSPRHERHLVLAVRLVALPIIAIGPPLLRYMSALYR